MWIQISCWYGIIMFGVYSMVLPQSDALLQKMPYRSAKWFKAVVEGISNNNDLRHTEFKELLRPLLIPRMPGTENNLRVQEYIRGHFERMNWAVESIPFEEKTPYGQKTFTNIIATFDPQVKNKLVIACHFDSKNMTDSAGNYLIAATDSAVPCAIMLDIAKKLDCGLQRKRDSGKRNPADDKTIQMLFFDGEEAYKQWTDKDSLYGSRNLAKWLRKTPDDFFPDTTRLDTVDLFVLLDLIGSTDVVFKNFFSVTSDSFAWLVKLENDLKKKNLLNRRGYTVKGYSDKILFSKQIPWGQIEDDHRPFLKEKPNIKVLHLISSPFPSVWHQMSDNEHAINYDVTDNFNRIFRVFVALYVDIGDVTCGK